MVGVEIFVLCGCSTEVLVGMPQIKRGNGGYLDVTISLLDYNRV